MPNKSNGSSSRGKTAQSGGRECCMCGDYGLPNHLFTCNVCRFRSQHRYCSNLYPRAESYRVCNWCLLLHQNDGSDRGDSNNAPSDPAANQESNPGDRGDWTSGRSLPVKKPPQTRARSPAPEEGPPPVAARKRAAVGKPKDDERVIRRTRSEEVMASNGGRGGGGGHGHSSSNGKGPCRNKVKRYKLLDEVSA